MRLVLLRSLPLVLVVALGAPAMAAVLSQPDPQAAAISCDRGRALNARLGVADVAYVSHFLPCVLRADREQLGLGFDESRFLSRSVAGALAQFIAATQLNHGDVSGAAALDRRTMHAIAAIACPRAGRYSYAFDTFDSDPPPELTPLALARAAVEYGHSVAHSAKLSFGVAVRRGVMFKGDDRDGVTAGWIAVRCI